METQQFSKEITDAAEALSCDFITVITYKSKIEAIKTYLSILVASSNKLMAARHLRRYQLIIMSWIYDLEELSYSTDTPAEIRLDIYEKVTQVRALLYQIRWDPELEENGRIYL